MAFVVLAMLYGLYSLFIILFHMPEIKAAEFPFTLIYEINGEKKAIKDTLIIEFDGVEHDIFAWFGYRKWKARLASGADEILMLEERDSNHVHQLINDLIDGDMDMYSHFLNGYDQSTQVYAQIVFQPGVPDYYMGDNILFIDSDGPEGTWIQLRVSKRSDPNKLKLWMDPYEREISRSIKNPIDEAELYDWFGIRILQWEVAPPIENEFGALLRQSSL